MDNRPIGMMDSGLGGLSVARVLRQQLPNESLVFVGDEGHFPYGTKPQATIRRLVSQIGQFLLHQDVKMMIIACNTATAAALDRVSQELPIPVIGVIQPGAKAAVRTGAASIGVIATDSTTQDGAYVRDIHQLSPNVHVVAQATQPLVSIVEHGQTGTAKAQVTVNQQLSMFDNHPVQALILGCTHFPFLSKEIQRKMGDKVKLVDPALETVHEARQYLTAHDLLAAQKESYVHLYSTGDVHDLIAGGDKWLAGQYDDCLHIDL